MNVDAAAAKAAAKATRRAAAREAWKPIVDAFARMTPGEEKQLVDQLNRVLGMLQVQYPDRVFKRNRQGCTVFDWPKKTPTRDVSRFFLAVSLQMVFICDDGYFVVEWGPDGWVRTFIAFAAHYAANGGAELATLLPFALAGRRHNPCLTTWGAHVDHLLGDFADLLKQEYDLATVDAETIWRIARGARPQSWILNLLIGSRPLSVLRVIFAHSRAGCLELNARLAPHIRTFIAVAAHYAANGGVEYATLIPFALSGRPHDPSFATWDAHVDHPRDCYTDHRLNRKGPPRLLSPPQRVRKRKS